jgi:hypothetical protein
MGSGKTSAPNRVIAQHHKTNAQPPNLGDSVELACIVSPPGRLRVGVFWWNA